MTKKRFLSFILSALLVMTAFVPLGAYAAEKTRKYLYAGQLWGFTANVNNDTNPIYGGKYETAMGGYNNYSGSPETGSGWESGGHSFDSVISLSAGDAVKISFAVGAEKYYPWGGFFWIHFEDSNNTREGENGESVALKYSDAQVAISPGPGHLEIDGGSSIDKKLPATVDKWNLYEIILTVGTDGTDNKLAVYKDGVEWYRDNNYSGCGKIKTIKKINFALARGDDRATYPFNIADAQIQYYSAAVAERGLEVVIDTTSDASDKGFELSNNSASVAVENYGNEAKPVSVIIASYNEDGSLAELAVDSRTIGPKVEQTLEAKLSGDTTGKTVKAFLWDNLAKLTPLAANK